MGEIIERRLKDYKGFTVLKVVENKGTKEEKVTYWLNDNDDNTINVFKTLKELKHDVDIIWSR